MPIDGGCGTQSSSLGLFPLALYFDQIQKMTRYGNAQDGEHNGSERRVKYGRIPKAPGATIPSKSGLSVRLPGKSPGLSGSDHEDSCGCSSISVYQLTGSDKGPTHCGEWKQFCRCLGPLHDFTSSPENQGKILMLFLLQGSQHLFSFSVSATITDPDALTTPEHWG